MHATPDLKAIIIDDEESGRETLRNILTRFCKGVEVVGTANSVATGVEVIRAKEPDVVFLDVEMPKAKGYELIQYFEQPDFEVIFVTAYDEYAILAFRLSAIDYLLKPVNPEELRQSLERVSVKKRQQQANLQYQLLLDNLNGDPKRIVLPTGQGYYFIDIDQIMRCEADGNYTRFILLNQEQILVSKTLKIYDEMLSRYYFFRINRSDLINLRQIKRYDRNKNPTLTLLDGTELIVSDSRKAEFWKIIQQLL